MLHNLKFLRLTNFSVPCLFKHVSFVSSLLLWNSRGREGLGKDPSEGNVDAILFFLGGGGKIGWSLGKTKSPLPPLAVGQRSHVTAASDLLLLPPLALISSPRCGLNTVCLSRSDIKPCNRASAETPRALWSAPQNFTKRRRKQAQRPWVVSAGHDGRTAEDVWGAEGDDLKVSQRFLFWPPKL